MKVEIWSDVMCPFCYLGKKNFEAALEKFEGKADVEVVWKSFQLNPNLGMQGMSTVAYLSEVKGLSVEQLRASFEGIREAGAQMGIHFDFDKAVVVNTGVAHRFLQFASSRGKGSEAEELLFKAHFSEGKNVALLSVLQGVGAELGFSAAEVEEAQADGQFQQAVEKDLYEARQLGISGVPFFVFDQKYAVSGAQPEHVFLDVLQKVVPGQETGAACDTDGNCD